MSRAVVIFIVLAMLGCSHQLELTNISQYGAHVNSDFDQRGLKIELVNIDRNEPERMFCQQLGDQLTRHGGYAVSINPAKRDTSDVKLNVSIDVDGSGKCSNFFVSWPGFIIFSQVWMGYGYTVDFTISCDATAAVTGAHIGSFVEKLHLDMRYADFDTTWAAGCGWVLLYTASAFINGFYVTSYDEDITPMLYSEAYPRLAAPVAERIVKMINNVKWESGDDTSY